eukprot:3873376-Alexandrium_andersonii.AAC.1
MCRFGMRVSGSAGAGGGGPLVRKPTRWASSAPEVLKRAGLRRRSEGLLPRDPRWREHDKLEGSRKMALAAKCPPALRVAILRGVTAQRAREGRALPEDDA